MKNWIIVLSGVYVVVVILLVNVVVTSLNERPQYKKVASPCSTGRCPNAGFEVI